MFLFLFEYDLESRWGINRSGGEVRVIRLVICNFSFVLNELRFGSLTIELSRAFQSTFVLGKNEYLYWVHLESI